MLRVSGCIANRIRLAVPEPTEWQPHEIAAQFPGDPVAVQLPFLRKIAATINKDQQSKEDADAVVKWAAALVAIYG